MAQSQPSVRWVIGSWVNVRVKAEANAKILTQLPANTEVQVDKSASNDKFCAIRWGKQQGYIACQFLAEQALRIQDIGVVSLSGQLRNNPDYSPTRAFWLEPGFQRLLQAGLYFESSKLSDKQKAQETIDNQFVWDKRPPLKRFTIPEFEAMKQRMKEGVIAPPSQYQQLPAWADIQKLAVAEKLPGKDTLLAAQLLDKRLFYPGVLIMLRQVELPRAGPSYFKSLSEIGRPSASTEELSAQFRLPYAIKIQSGPFWQQSKTGSIKRLSWWDIGSADVFLQKPVYQHSLMLNGILKSDTSQLKYSSGSEDCKKGFRLADPAAQDGTVKSLKDSGAANELMFHFYSKEKLSSSVSGRFKPDLGEPVKLLLEAQAIQPRHEQFTQAAVTSIDIDQDAQADFAVVEAWTTGALSTASLPEPGYRLIFVNVAGSWYLLDIDQYSLCDR